jgi:hypothetical protein
MHSAAFKAKVALVAVRGDKTFAELAQQHGALALRCALYVRFSVRQGVLHKEGLLTGKLGVNGLDAVERYRRIEMPGLRKATRDDLAPPLVRQARHLGYRRGRCSVLGRGPRFTRLRVFEGRHCNEHARVSGHFGHRRLACRDDGAARGHRLHDRPAEPFGKRWKEKYGGSAVEVRQALVRDVREKMDGFAAAHGRFQRCQ